MHRLVVKNTAPYAVNRAGIVFPEGETKQVYVGRVQYREIKACTALRIVDGAGTAPAAAPAPPADAGNDAPQDAPQADGEGGAYAEVASFAAAPDNAELYCNEEGCGYGPARNIQGLALHKRQRHAAE